MTVFGLTLKSTLVQANEMVTSDELKEIFDVPSHEMVNRHVHKLVQVTSFLILRISIAHAVSLYAKCWGRQCTSLPTTW